MHTWVIILIVIAAAVIADIIYLVRKKKSGKCSCGSVTRQDGSCGCCKGCNHNQ